MIEQLIPLLATHKLKLDLELDGDDIWVYVFPEYNADTKVSDKTKGVLEQRYMQRYNKDEITNEKVARDILLYVDVMTTGTTSMVNIAKQMKLQSDALTKELKEKATGKKPAPKRKTKAQLEAEKREAARAKQAEERKDEKPPAEEANRLDTEITPDVSNVTKQPKIIDRLNEKSAEDKPDGDDPLGLGLGSIDL
jgi:hypothetical protein